MHLCRIPDCIMRRPIMSRWSPLACVAVTTSPASTGPTAASAPRRVLPLQPLSWTSPSCAARREGEGGAFSGLLQCRRARAGVPTWMQVQATVKMSKQGSVESDRAPPTDRDTTSHLRSTLSLFTPACVTQSTLVT